MEEEHFALLWEQNHCANHLSQIIIAYFPPAFCILLLHFTSTAVLLQMHFSTLTKNGSMTPDTTAEFSSLQDSSILDCLKSL